MVKVKSECWFGVTCAFDIDHFYISKDNIGLLDVKGANFRPQALSNHLKLVERNLG